MKKLLLILAMLLPSLAHATTYTVNSGQSEATIQGVINGATAGDTISFTGGTYNLASNGGNPNNAALNLKAGLFYTGPTSGTAAHLVGTGFYALMYFTGTTVSVQHFTFDNGFIFLEDHTTSATIDNNIFQNIDCGTTSTPASQTTAIFVAGGLNNSDISSNTFQNIGASCFTHFADDGRGAGGINLFAFHNLTITNNTFTNIIEGVGIAISGGGGYDGAGGHFNNNTFTGVHRIALEMLGTSTNPTGLEVANNNYFNPLNPWAVSFCLSLTAGQNMTVHDNVCNGNLNSPNAPPYGIEIAGNGTQAFNNTVEGYWQSGFAIGNTGAPISITGNKICGPTMNTAPSSGSTPVVGNANGFISWEAASQGGTFTGNVTSGATTCATGPVTLTANVPPYGWQVMSGAIRTIPVFPGGTGATTKKINWSATGGATLSCSMNCPPVVTVTITASPGTCSVTGSVGSYVLHSTSDVILTGQSVDDNSKTVTIPFHVCDTSASAKVAVTPTYNQVYETQSKTLFSWVPGIIDDRVTWAITSAPGGGDATLADTTNRDTVFIAGVVPGRYTVTATSVVNPSLSASVIEYVAPVLLPPYPATGGRTADLTEPTACFVDSAMTGSDLEVGPSQAITDPVTINGQTLPPGTLIRLHNEGPAGNPTVFNFAMLIRNNFTPTQPLYICSVPNPTTGEAAIIDGTNAHENAADAGTFTDGFGAFKFTGTASGFSQPYNLGSVGPDNVSIVGLHIRNFADGVQYFRAGSSTPSTYTGAAAIWVATANFLHIEGIYSDNNAFGMLANANTSGGGRRITMFHSWTGGHIKSFATAGTFGEHGLYMEGLYGMVEGNLIEQPNGMNLNGGTAPNYSNGDYNKIRGGDTVVRWNLYRGLLTNHVIEFPDMEDTWQFVTLDGYLGVPGSTNCSLSVNCSIPGGMSLGDLTINQQALARDIVYGNVFANERPIVSVQYGSQSAPLECPPCTNMDDRQGNLYFFNNTVDKAAAPISTINYNTGGFVAVNPIYSQTSATVVNNAFWSDPTGVHAFTVNLDGTFVGSFKTNMYASGVMHITTPISGGTGTGFGNFVNSISWPVQPLDAHMTGLTLPNFLSTSTLPYNAGTFVPIPSSPLIGAGTATPLPGLPCRFQPNAYWGYMDPRTDNCTTIGAVQSGPQPTITSVTLLPSNNVYPVPPPNTIQTYLAMVNWSSPQIPSQQVQSNTCGWNSSNGASMQFFGTCSSVGQVYPGAASGSGNVTMTYPGFSPSTPFAVGSAVPTVADPVFSPAGGAFSSAQSVTITSATSGASIIWTNNGSTPTVSSGCTITNGSLYSGAVTVSTSQTLKALGCKVGDTSSNVVSSAYTITTTVANPTCAPPAGTYTTGQTPTCSSTTPGSTTYCTIDGSTPTSSSPVCSSIIIGSSLTLKAISEASGLTNSSVISFPYVINITPTIVSILVSPSTATILTTGTQSFVCTATMSDSSTQPCSSAGTTTWTSSSPSIATVNSSGLASGVAPGSTTIQAAISGVTPSSGTLTVNAPVVANPTFTPPANNYVGTQNIVIATSTSGASIVYTNDGTTPTVTSLTCTITHGTLYTGPVSVSTSQTLNALGCKTGDTASSVIPAAYVITPPGIPTNLKGTIGFNGTSTLH